MPEAACLTAEPVIPQTLTRLDNNICLYISGMGAERAADAARDMLNFGMEVLVSFGTAGAVVSDIEPGDLCIPESVIAYDGTVYYTAKHWRTNIVNKLTDCPCNIYLGQMVDTLRVLTTVEEKSNFAMHNKSALAVDMESAAIAAIATENEVPFIVIRVITDSSSMALPELATKTCDIYGNVQFSKFFRQVLSHPAQIPPLFRLARGFKSASATMKWIGQRLTEIF